MSSINTQTVSGTSSNMDSGVTSKDKENIDDSESIASDESEEMIEVDEDEFEMRRAACLADMKELETQFLKL